MKRFLIIFLTVVSLALLCASFLGFASSASWFFDLFNHFRVQFLVAGVLGLSLGLVLQSKPLTWIFATTALVNVLFIAPLFLPQPDQPKSSTGLSIVSYNTWIHNGHWAAVRPMLQADDPDIVFLTETHPNIQTGVHALDSDFHIFQLGTDVLLVRRRAGLDPKLIQTSADDGIAGIPVKFSVDGVEVILLAVHPAAPLSSTFAATRDQSFAAIASFLANHKGLKIVVGDFNATPWSRPFRVLQEQTGLVNSQKGFGIQSTWPSYPGSKFNWLLRIPIDHCLHSPSVYTIDRRVGGSGSSNHNPIFIRLGLSTSTAAG